MEATPHSHDPPKDPSTAQSQGGVDADLLRGIMEAASAFRELVQGSPKEKLYWYWSPKAGDYVEIRGDTAFMMTILDEFDPQVMRIEVEAPEQVIEVEGEATGIRYDSRVFLHDGTQLWKEAKRADDAANPDNRTKHQLDAEKSAAAKAGAKYRLVKDTDLRRHHVRFWNSLALLGWINRVRGVSSFEAEQALNRFMEGKSGCALEDLLAIEGADPAIVLGLIARRVAFGTLSVDLSRRLTRKSIFAAEGTEDIGLEATPQEQAPSASFPRVRCLPKRGDFGDLSLDLLDKDRWPRVNLDFVRHKALFERRYEAVSMFYKGCSECEIRDKTGLRDDDVVALIRRCAREDAYGTPVGFPGLIRHGYMRTYQRTAPAPGWNVNERTVGGGWSGLFNDLLSKFDDLVVLLADQTYEASRTGTPKRPKWTHIHET